VVAIACTGALQNLARDGAHARRTAGSVTPDCTEHARAAITAGGGAEGVVHALKRHRDCAMLLDPACGALALIASDSECCRSIARARPRHLTCWPAATGAQAAIAAGAVPLLVAAIEGAAEPGTAARICRALSSLLIEGAFRMARGAGPR
jgi:hypothetical protein